MASGISPEQSTKASKFCENQPNGSSDFGGDFELELADAENGKDNWLKCCKNPGHKHMIPNTGFSLNHLPAKWRHAEVFFQIKNAALLTVKLTVSYVSPKRPDRYCDPAFRGTRMISVGSGFAKISRKPLPQPDIDCPLKNCSIVSGSHKVTAMFDVYTASHVVFDDSEAEHTRLEFLYDTPDCSSVVHGQVAYIDYTHVQSDTCRLRCVSHDLNLFQKLVEYHEKFSMPPPPSQLTLNHAPFDDVPTPPLVVVVGHPHGYYKHLSFGEWVGYQDILNLNTTCELKAMDWFTWIELTAPDWRQNGWRSDVSGGTLWSPGLLNDIRAMVLENPDITLAQASPLGKGRNSPLGFTSITYTADTCPGSSGAVVMVFFQNGDDKDAAITTTHFRHRKEKGNASGIAMVPDTWNDKIRDFVKNMSTH